MAAEKVPEKVLVVTNYSGVMNIAPLKNQDYYLSRNMANKGKKEQYRIQSMAEADAVAYLDEHKSIDPQFVTPQQAAAAIVKKDATISEQEEKIEELKKQLAAGGTGTQYTSTAEEVIVKIKEAKAVSDIIALIAGDTRKTVLDAGTKKITELTTPKQ